MVNGYRYDKCDKYPCSGCARCMRGAEEEEEDPRGPEYVILYERAERNNQLYDPDFWINQTLDNINQGMTNLQINANQNVDPNADQNADQNADLNANPNANPNQSEVYIPPRVAAQFDQSRIQILPNVCAVCRNDCNNRITDVCDNSCAYYCCDECAGRWIVSRLGNPHPYCMICGSEYGINQVSRVVTDNGFVNVVHLMINDGLLDPNNLSAQFFDYVNYRNLNMWQLLPNHNPPNDHVLENRMWAA